MAVEILYGNDTRLRLEMPATAVIADYSHPQGTPLDDPSAAVHAAVSDPLDFPPLTAAIVPGDRIAIALEAGTPRAGDIVAGLLKAIWECDHELGSIHVVVAPGASSELADLPESLRKQVTITEHDPRDTGSLSYLAASEAGEPIYFNKQICDADLVVPVSTARVPQSPGYFGVHSGLFPQFSDTATQNRFRVPDVGLAVHDQRCAEVNEAAWLLGVQLLVQVVPGGGSEVLEVIAGEPGAVARRGAEICNLAWNHATPNRARLVIAGIAGGPAQQTWDNVARALHAASGAVLEEGTVLLCTDLSESPGPALMQLANSSDDEHALRELARDHSEDAPAAAMLVTARQRSSIYLLSDLGAEVVEALGVGHVHGIEDLERLVTQFDECIVIGNAQHAAFRVPSAEGLGVED